MRVTPQELHYIAGPYRGNVRANVRTAEFYAAECAKRGIYFICPHLNSAFMDHDAAPEFWLAMDKRLLRQCAVILLLPGWESSAGACEERAEAERLALRVYDIDDYVGAYDANRSGRTGGASE